MTDDEELRRRLRHLADHHSVADVGLEEVRRTGHRRGQRRRAAAIVAALAVFVGGFSVVRSLTDDSEPDVASGGDDNAVDAADPSEADQEEADTDEDESAPTTSSLAATASLEASGDFVSAGASLSRGVPNWILPWGDGFVSLGTVYEPPPLPDFDSELADLFPQEIIDVVRDAGATNLDEAMSALSEVGLLEEASAIVTENPELSDQLIGVPGTTTFEARTSPDGVNWTDVDFAPPAGAEAIYDVHSDGEHLLVSGQRWSDDGTTSDATVAFTSDLASWTVVDIPLPVPVDIPNHVSSSTSLGSVAIGPDGWYVTTFTSSWVDLWELMPADLRAEAEEGGFGWRPTEDGVAFEDYGYGALEEFAEFADGENQDGGQDVEEIREEITGPEIVRVVPWSELGIDWATYAPYIEGGEGSTSAWRGDWSGSLEPATLPGEGAGCCTIVGTDAGFVAQTWPGDYYEGDYGVGGDRAELWFSADGQTWSARPNPVAEGWFESLVAVDDGVLLISSVGDGRRFWRAAADASGWEEVAPPELPGDPHIWFGPSGGRGVASVIDVAGYDFEPPPLPEYEVTVEHDGYSIYNHVWPDGSGEVVITVIDTGEVVLEAESESLGPEGLPGFVEFAGQGIAFLDGEGTVVVEVPIDVLLDPVFAAQEQARAESGYVEPVYRPDLWLIASRDARTWFTVDLTEPADDAGFYGPAGINGGLVAVPVGDDWVTFEIG